MDGIGGGAGSSGESTSLLNQRCSLAQTTKRHLRDVGLRPRGSRQGRLEGALTCG
jgi:hypothetical protein